MIISLGMTIKLSFKPLKSVETWLIIGVKLIIMPLVMLISNNPLLVLQASMPSQLLTTILYRDKEVDVYCFLSILVGFFTVPFFYLLTKNLG
jgi:hypothetical protein